VPLVSLNGVILGHRDSFTFTEFVDDFHSMVYLTDNDSD
jgi:hypothetical protein